MRFATDTGGTFTDLVVENDAGAIRLYKAQTVPGDPVQGVVDALTLAAIDNGVDLATLLGRGELFIHGTTHAINAIITGRTAKTALLVTRGHPDIMVFREGGRTEPFNHAVAFPKPFIPRSLTFEVDERILSDGSVHTVLDEVAARGLIGELRDAQVEAVAVCLLWSTINPAHEIRLAALLAEYLPSVPVSLSHVVNPTLREFRRASATAIDASLKPIMSRYMGGLNDRLRQAGYAGEVMVLTSSGGMMAGEDVAHHPIRVINSGPSMAPIAGRHYAKLDQRGQSAIVADTGGTTYDISLVRDDHVPMTRELWIGERFRGHLVGYPSVDVKSVGAGGGSIARVDAGGLLAPRTLALDPPRGAGPPARFQCDSVRGSEHVLFEPLQHLAWPTLEFEITVPTSRTASDPLELLVRDGDVVEHRLHIARVRQQIIMHLIQKRRNADLFSPFCRCSSGESDARSKEDSLLQIVDALGRNSREHKAPSHDDLHRDRLRAYEAAYLVEGGGIVCHRAECRTATKAAAQETDHHVACALASADVLQ